jgi:hypothetical protein
MVCLIYDTHIFILKKNLMVSILKRHLRQNVHNGITALLMLQFRPEISLPHTH